MSSIASRTRQKGGKALSAAERGGRFHARGAGGNTAKVVNPLIASTDVAAVRVSADQMLALSVVYNSSAVVQAIRSVLQSHLLAGGVVVKRDGTPVELKDHFRLHVEEHFTRFARDVLDAVLVLGFVPVVYEKHVPEQSLAAPPDAATGVSHTLPHVPPIGLYELERAFGGESGFTSSYRVFHKLDPMRHVENTRVFVRTPPDIAGNVVSAVSSVHDLSTFSSVMIELAVTAERDRTSPTIATQHRPSKEAPGFGVVDMFTDSSAQTAHANQTSGQSQRQLQELSSMVLRTFDHTSCHVLCSYTFTPYRGAPCAFYNAFCLLLRLILPGQFVQGV